MIIKNGLIVSEQNTYKADILLKDEKIECIGNNIAEEGHEIIDAEGKYVIPGAIDVHTHMNLIAGKYPTVDDFYSGTIAAACGGTTTIVDHLGFGPKGCNLSHQINKYHELAHDKAMIDYSFHGVVQHLNDKILDELEHHVNNGIISFKVYMTYNNKLSDDKLYRVLKKMKQVGGIVPVHAENDQVINYFRAKYKSQGKIAPIYHAKSRPNNTESEAIGRILNLAKLAGDAPVYIVHLSTKEGLIEVKEARKRGQKNIFVETCTQYLTLTQEEYKKDNFEGLKYIMAPPLRTKKDIDFLWDGINQGDIQTIGTDHCPFSFRQKLIAKNDFTIAPGGGPGVEERVSVIFSEGVSKGKISINKFVEVMCTNPSKIYGLYPKKGVIQPGSDADIVIINPNIEQEIKIKDLHGNSDYSMYEGLKVKCKIDRVILRGTTIVKENKFLSNRIKGKFIKRKKVNKNL